MAGLDMWKWDNNEYPMTFKAKVMAWYNMHNVIEANRHDVEAEDAERRSKHK